VLLHRARRALHTLLAPTPRATQES
jgi:hypothetical protein